jgi:tetratricopeptide (TPR) repeat protein
MIMKKGLIMLVLFLPLLAACQRIEEKKSFAIPAAIDHSHKLDDAQGPDYNGLIEEYRATLADDPDNLSALVALGNAYFDSHQWKKAIAVYEHVLRIDPHHSDVRTDMGTALRTLGMTDRALAEYRFALEHDPSHLNARYNMGIILAYDKKDIRSAIRLWEEVLNIAPNHPQAEEMRAAIAAFHRAHAKGVQ